MLPATVHHNQKKVKPLILVSVNPSQPAYIEEVLCNPQVALPVKYDGWLIHSFFLSNCFILIRLMVDSKPNPRTHEAIFGQYSVINPPIHLSACLWDVDETGEPNRNPQ